MYTAPFIVWKVVILVKAVDYLSQLAKFDEDIKQKSESVQMYFDMATSITVSMNPNKVQTTRTNDRMSSAVEKAVDLQKKMEADVIKHMEQKEIIIRQIQGLRNVKFIQLLFKRYVQYKNLKVTASEMGMSYQYVRGLHKQALAEFEETYADMLQKADEERNGVTCQI